MGKFNLRIQQLEETTLYGVWSKSSQARIHRDIPGLTGLFTQLTGKRAKAALPFYVITKDYDALTGSFALFVGCRDWAEGLEQAVLPGGTYAVMTVRPKLSAWGGAIGQAKQFFYEQWLPDSAFVSRNLESELHTSRSIGLRPSIELLFAIEDKV